jgi:hypothetical protein
MIAYHARPFVLCGLPLRQPPADRFIHARRNGSDRSRRSGLSVPQRCQMMATAWWFTPPKNRPPFTLLKGLRNH